MMIHHDPGPGDRFGRGLVQSCAERAHAYKSTRGCEQRGRWRSPRLRERVAS